MYQDTLGQKLEIGDVVCYRTDSVNNSEPFDKCGIFMRVSLNTTNPNKEGKERKMKVSKKALRQVSDRIVDLLMTSEELRCLIGRRVVGVGFNGEAEGVYRLEFDDGSTAEFTSRGDDMTVTLVTLSPFQASLVKGAKK